MITNVPFTDLSLGPPDPIFGEHTSAPRPPGVTLAAGSQGPLLGRELPPPGLDPVPWLGLAGAGPQSHPFVSNGDSAAGPHSLQQPVGSASLPAHSCAPHPMTGAPQEPSPTNLSLPHQMPCRPAGRSPKAWVSSHVPSVACGGHFLSDTRQRTPFPGSAGGALLHAPKGREFDPWLGRVQGATDRCFSRTSMSLSLSLSPLCSSL